MQQLTQKISIHAPPRGATSATCRKTGALIFQFTPLREGRPFPSILHPNRGDISIHAPPRGATRTSNQRNAEANQFQFTPLREGRLDLVTLDAEVQCISIHAPPRGATSGGIYRVEFLRISIHAPPRGATTCVRNLWRSTKNFNSRPSARGDTSKRYEVLQHSLFQFTPLREGRPAVSRVVFLPFVFQFTPLREGRRPFRGREVLFRRISIHAPPRGATW